MIIEATTRNEKIIKLETDGRVKGLKTGDLIEEWDSDHGKEIAYRKAVVIGFSDDKDDKVWTMRESNGFEIGYWRNKFVSKCTKLIERPNNPDLTIEGLKTALGEFSNKN